MKNEKENLCVMCKDKYKVANRSPKYLAIPDEYNQDGPICKVCVIKLEEKYNDPNW